MNVDWCGEFMYKAYFDPGTSEIHIHSSRSSEEGTSTDLGESVRLDLDTQGLVSLVTIQTENLVRPADELQRPADCGIAENAEFEVDETAVPWGRFDATKGTLALGFGTLIPTEWGRMGESLVWIALDEQHRLAGLMLEGVSTDSGGEAQARWLEEGTRG